MMFSRASSLASLDSCDQHSIHSSVFSDYSRSVFIYKLTATLAQYAAKSTRKSVTQAIASRFGAGSVFIFLFVGQLLFTIFI